MRMQDISDIGHRGVPFPHDAYEALLFARELSTRPPVSKLSRNAESWIGIGWRHHPGRCRRVEYVVNNGEELEKTLNAVLEHK